MTTDSIMTLMYPDTENISAFQIIILNCMYIYNLHYSSELIRILHTYIIY